jgi:hypothetical protein
VLDRFLDIKDTGMLRPPRHEMLWALKNEVPTEVRKTYEIGESVLVHSAP